jgi:hypothetical protein
MGLVPEQRDPETESRAMRSSEPLSGVTLPWEAAAEERLRRIPIPAVRATVIELAEAHARSRGLAVVDPAAYDAAVRGETPGQ